MGKKVVLGVVVAACFIIFALVVRFFVLKERTEDEKEGVKTREIKQDETKKPPKTEKKVEPPKAIEEKKEIYPFEVDVSYLKMLKALRQVEVSLDVKEMTMEQVLDELSSQAGIPIELSETVKHLSKNTVTLKVPSLKLEYVLRLLCQSIFDAERRDADILIRSGRVLIADRNEVKSSEAEQSARLILIAQEMVEREEETKRLKNALKEKRLSLEVAEASLEEVIAQLGGSFGFPVNLAEGTDFDKTKRISLVENNAPAEQVVDVVCRHFGVEYWIEDGILLFCDRFIRDEFIRKEEEKKQAFDSFLTSLTLKLEAHVNFVEFFRKLSESKSAPRVYPSKPVWLKNPKSTLPAGEYSLKEILSSFAPVLKVVPLKTEEFYAIILLLEE
ncbi:MAG: hypothetical protein N2234_01955 [Planctomycetota bacterium]|nr:hypothetical protein [Planctomycetota bacterium]